MGGIFVCDFICNCCLDFLFYVCVLGQNGRARTPWWCVCYGDMIVRFWWPAMTSLMCFTFWCLLFVSVPCIAFLVGSVSFSPVTLFATPSGGERLYPYLFTCHVSPGHLFLWPYLWFYVSCWYWYFGSAGSLVVFFFWGFFIDSVDFCSFAWSPCLFYRSLVLILFPAFAV